MQRQLHIQGRYGITIFAWSGIEMALWDIAAKRTECPWPRLLGGRKRETRSGLCQSGALWREPLPVAKSDRGGAAQQGFTDVKLHEIAADAITAARDAGGRPCASPPTSIAIGALRRRKTCCRA